MQAGLLHQPTSWGWQWVDPEKEFKAVVLAIRAGLMSRSEAADNARADALGLVLDSDPRKVARTGAAQPDAESGAERERDEQIEREPDSGENEPMNEMRRPA